MITSDYSTSPVLTKLLNRTGASSMVRGALLSAMCLLPAFAFAAQSRPNIVYILADDLGYGDLTCLNTNSKIPTPNLDRLAGAGMIFTDAHSSSAVCTPTRYGVMTGRYNWRTPLQHGVLNGYSAPLIEPGRLTVAALLKRAGYRTGCVGKWHLGLGFVDKGGKPLDGTAVHERIAYDHTLVNGPREHGFDYSFIIPASLDMPPYVYIENDKALTPPTDLMKGAGGQHLIRGGPKAPGFEQSQVLPNFTAKAVQFIKESATKREPFFLYFPLNSPHTPIEPLPEFKGKSKAGIYGDFVAETDFEVGEVLQALDQAGVASNTIVLFASDNGSSPTGFPPAQSKEFGHDSSYVFRGTKSDIWDGGHHIPFLVRWPTSVKAGSRSATPVCLNDLMATAAELSGAKLPDNAGEDSVSLLPVLTGKSNGPASRAAIVHHSIDGVFAIRDQNWKLVLSAGSGGWSKPKGVKETDLPAIQLYDVAADISETNNLQAAHPEIVVRLSGLLRKYIADGRSTPGPAQTNDVAINIWKNPRVEEAIVAAERSVSSPAKKGKRARAENIGEPKIYKRVNDRDLKLFLVKPADWKATDQRPAALFFHGGSWVGGTPSQFKVQADYLASRGMVCALVEYRLLENGSHEPPTICVRDAKSAMRWMRSHAAELGVDPARIAAAGGSAGGHLAAFVGLVPGQDDPQDDLSISVKPAALVLFNPVFNNGPGNWGHNRVGERYKEFSPAHNITSNAPPTIVFLGTSDKLIPVPVVKDFKADMERVGVRCEAVFYEGQPHGFFNHEPYEQLSLIEADKFLASLGWLNGPPTLKAPALSASSKG